MKINLYYQNQTKEFLLPYRSMFKKLAKTVISSERKDGIYEVSLTIVDDNTIHQYNKQYRNIDRPTDVLSFALLEADALEIDNLPINIGDIVISIDTAKRQAKEYGHSLKRELAFLTVHSLLHLFGYDHMNKEDEKVMFAKQEEILRKEGITR